MMRKILIIGGLVTLILLVACTAVKATTQSELEAYLVADHTVAGKTVHFTEENKVRVKRYLAENTLTDEQATAIKAKFDEGLAYMDKAGVTEVRSLDSNGRKEIFEIAKEAFAIAGLTATYNSSDKTVEIYKDGTVIEAVSTEVGKLVQTGNNNSAYIVVAGAAIIAVAAIVTVKKVKANA